MKKTTILTLAAGILLTSSCGIGLGGQLGGTSITPQTSSDNATTTTTSATSSATSALGSVLSNVGTGALGNILSSVLGLDNVTKADLIGTWKYSQPGCAFTSQDLLAKAGGEVAADQVKQKLATTYQKVGLSSSNTSLTFNQDGTFTAVLGGKQVSGNYTYNESNGQIALQTLLLSATCYTKKNSNGMGFLFESTKLLTLMQGLSAVSGNSTLKTVGDLSSKFDGLRMGFDMTR